VLKFKNKFGSLRVKQGNELRTQFLTAAIAAFAVLFHGTGPRNSEERAIEKQSTCGYVLAHLPGQSANLRRQMRGRVASKWGEGQQRIKRYV
jgi:hypothetical protein